MPDFHDTGLTCLRCGSSSVIPDAEIIDSNGSPLKVNVQRKPEASMFKGRVYSTVRFQVCGVCGNVEMYAEDPEALWDAYRDRDESRS
ncbi:MAG: hypothetical protein AAF170_01510 [Bacteroidota bacterium]